jgi:hypothetical protein
MKIVGIIPETTSAERVALLLDPPITPRQFAVLQAMQTLHYEFALEDGVFYASSGHDFIKSSHDVIVGFLNEAVAQEEEAAPQHQRIVKEWAERTGLPIVKASSEASPKSD